MMRRKIPTKWSVIALGAVCVFAVGIFLFRQPISRAVWHSTHLAPLATMFAPSDADLLFEIGNYYFGAGAYDIKKSEGYIRTALISDPNLLGAHYQLARMYFILGDFYGALAEINTELHLHPDFKRSYYVRALIYGYSEQLAAAEADFKTFLAWKPESWAGNNDLAWIYFQEGKYAEARDAARAGLELFPGNPWLLNSLGVALLNTGEEREAEGAFTQALTILSSMSEKDWGAAYPGNDPSIYAQGYAEMKASLEENLKLLSVGDTAHP